MKRIDYPGSRENIDRIITTGVNSVSSALVKEYDEGHGSKDKARDILTDGGKNLGKNERKILRRWLNSHNSSNAVRNTIEQDRILMAEYLLGIPKSNRPITEEQWDEKYPEMTMTSCDVVGSDD